MRAERMLTEKWSGENRTNGPKQYHIVLHSNTTKQYQLLLCTTKQYHLLLSNTTDYCKHYQLLLCTTKQYHLLLSNTIDYCALLNSTTYY